MKINLFSHLPSNMHLPQLVEINYGISKTAMAIIVVLGLLWVVFLRQPMQQYYVGKGFLLGQLRCWPQYSGIYSVEYIVFVWGMQSIAILATLLPDISQA